MPEKIISPNHLKKEEPVSGTSSPPFSSETAAWNSFRQGNESAFIFIYESYFKVLYAYGFSIVADSNMVKDALQDLFVELRERRDHLGPTDSIKFYLFKCLKRKLVKELANWPGKRESLEVLSMEFQFTLSHETQLIDRQLSAEKIDKLNEAISKLSPRQREIIHYSFFEGFTYQQIQDMMGLENQQTTRNLMYKAIKFLRKQI